MGYEHRFIPGVTQIVPAISDIGLAEEIDYQRLLAQWIKEVKSFRAMLDRMSLADAIKTIAEETADKIWWTIRIKQWHQDEWEELFKRLLGEDTEWDEMDEKNKDIWKRFFDKLIKDLEHPGAPPDPVDPVKIDNVADKVNILEERVADVEGKLALKPLGPMPAVEEDPAYPAIPNYPNPGDHGLRRDNEWHPLVDHLEEVREYYRKVLFSMGWAVEHAEVCLSELQRNRAPGTETDSFKANFTSLNNALIVLEQGSVFHD